MPVHAVHTAKSLDHFLAITHEVYQSWDDQGELPDPWFRGLSSAKHTLQPSWYRLGDRSEGIDEDDLWDEFERRAVPLIEGPRPGSAFCSAERRPCPGKTATGGARPCNTNPSPRSRPW